MSTISDAFTGGISSNWEAWGNEPIMVGASDKIRGGDNAYSGAVWKTTADTFADDQESEAYLDDISSSESYAYLGVMVRGNNSGGTAGYMAFAHKTDNRDIYKHVAGSETRLTSSSNTWTAGVTYRLKVVGNDLELFIDDVSDETVTDTSVSSGQPGMCAYDADNDEVFLDNFAATDDFGGGSLSIPIAAYHYNIRLNG